MKETKLIATILSILAVYAAFYFVCYFPLNAAFTIGNPTCSMSLSFAVLVFIFFWFCLFGRATCFMLQALLR